MKASPIAFRDPAGFLYDVNGRIIRAIVAGGVGDLNSFFASETVREFMEYGKIVGTKELARNEVDALEMLEESVRNMPVVLEHERIFQSYPYEWSPEMLYAAGNLTLDLAEGLLKDGLGLKDATPFNVLFKGADPVFVDVMSVEKREPCDATWTPYAQFIRTFILPLMVYGKYGLTNDRLFLTKRDGLEPAEVYNLLSMHKRLLPSNMSLVTMPTLLGDRKGALRQNTYSARKVSSSEKAQFILRMQFRSLRKHLKRHQPKAGRTSQWTEYLEPAGVHSENYISAKEAFVDHALAECRPQKVLDVGCNDGHFSVRAARAGADVVALDADEAVVGPLWTRAQSEGLSILPLVSNIANPTPTTGWRNRERASLLDRIEGKFDMVMMLAVIHHMLVTERIPLSEIIDLAADVTTNYAIIEYIDTNDRMFKTIARGRDDLHSELSRDNFESACSERFRVIRKEMMLNEDRWIYLLQKHNIDC